MEFQEINYEAIECESILLSDGEPHYEPSYTSYHKESEDVYECNYNIDRYNQFHKINKNDLLLVAWLTMAEEDYLKFDKEKGEETVRVIADRKNTIKMTRDNGDEITVYLATPLEMKELEGKPYVEKLEISDERGFPVYSNIYLREGGGTTLIYFKEHLHPVAVGEIREWDGRKYIAKQDDGSCEKCAFNMCSCTTAEQTTYIGECETNQIRYEVIGGDRND